MNQLLKEHKKTLIINILLSILMVVAIPGLILSAIKSSFLLMGICILIVVFDFYGLPFFWIHYGEQKTIISIVRLVVNEHLLDINILSETLGINEQEATQLVKKCIQKGYIKGYSFSDGKLVEIEKPKINILLKCPNCGADDFTVGEDIAICNFCGTKVHL